MAGLIWLMQSSALTACGRHIANLQQQRSELLERRSAALLGYAAATALDAREARAKELGYGPPNEVTQLPVDFAIADAPGFQAAAIGGGPLGIVLGDDLRDAARDAGILSRWRMGTGPVMSAGTSETNVAADTDR
jgi:hypothetical protein